MTEKQKFIKKYLEMTHRIRFEFEREVGYTPDTLIIHPASKLRLMRIIREMAPEYCFGCNIESFMGMKIIESELFTSPTSGIITNGVKITNEHGGCTEYRIIGKSLPIP